MAECDLILSRAERIPNFFPSSSIRDMKFGKTISPEQRPRICFSCNMMTFFQHCAPRPLGDPPDEECPSDGVNI